MQAQPGEQVHPGAAIRLQDPLPHLLQQQRVRQGHRRQCCGGRLLECHHAAVTNMARQAAHQCGALPDEKQHATADDRIEVAFEFDGRRVADDERDTTGRPNSAGDRAVSISAGEPHSSQAACTP